MHSCFSQQDGPDRLSTAAARGFEQLHPDFVLQVKTSVLV
jgi:hypothetical protein